LRRQPISDLNDSMRPRFAPLLLLLAACSTVKETARKVDWQSPPPGPPGHEARSGDQSEPRLEALGAPARPAPPPAELAQAAALTDQANAQRDAGNLPGAIESLREALTLREAALGADAPDVASTLTSLAGLYAAGDDYDAAEPLLRRALAIREKVYGADDRRTALSRNNLALLLAAEGRSAEAEMLYLQAIAVLQDTNSVDLATVLENYAALLADTGRAQEAEATEKRAKLIRADASP
jgi:tetratricopeptide (TPR) repeat protein